MIDSDTPPGQPSEVDLGPARSTVHSFTAQSPGAPVVLMVPALGVPARHYLGLGAALAERGVHAMVMDLRGVGSNSVRARRGVDWGYLDLVDVELRQLFEQAGRRWPSARRHWLGHSLGGQLCLLHQARHPEQKADSVVLAATGSPWVATFDPPMRWLVGLFARVVRFSTRQLGVFRGDWLRFGGAQGATLMTEWSGFCLSGRLGRLGAEGWDADAALATLQRPLLGLSMTGDTYAPLRSTQRLAAMTAGTFELQRIEHVDGHLPGHFRWLRHPAEPASRIAQHLHSMATEQGQ